MRRVLVLLAALGLLSLGIVAEEAPLHFQRDAIAAKSFPAAPRVAMKLTAPAAALEAAEVAAADQLDAIRHWNAAGRLPAKNAFVRPLPDPVSVSIGAFAAKTFTGDRAIVAETSRGLVYGTSFRVKGAARLRLHLQNVDFPDGTVLWVYGSSGEPVAFDRSLIAGEKSIWAPSVEGELVYLEVEVPRSAEMTASFEVTEILEILNSRHGRAIAAPNDEPTCLVSQNANCISSAVFPAVQAARAAVGQMEFVKDGSGYVCSGTLINDQQSSGTAYFLTANHCIASQPVASSLETYFDFVWTNCGWENITYLNAVVGSTLMTTSTASDVTLLRLSSLPAGRVFLGWSTSAVPNGALLHRISHPVPDGSPGAFPQMYSRTVVKTTGATCSGASRPAYIYSNESNGGAGGVYGGSSGSAVILSNSANDARIVGQLRGSCGPDPAAACDRRNDTMDGAFATSFGVLATYLSSNPQQPQPCVPSSDTICLVDNRFSVRLTYDVGQGAKPMTAIKYTPDSGLFWFDNSSNIEVLLKMVNACSFNQRFWVYAGGTTDVGVGITVTDTKTGTVKNYSNVRGTKFVTITDSSAFATCP